MITIHLPQLELLNEETMEFIYLKEKNIQLEHSLVSISKWESIWHKPFLHTKNKTMEETISYIKCMTITQNVDPLAYRYIPSSEIERVTKYIDDPMTATWFRQEESKKKNDEIVTSEIIYYWMISLNIPVEFQRWHLNRLITLIRVCSEKNRPEKKMSKKELLNRNRSLNAARRKAMNSKG